jgi:hypothetical protein
MVKKVIRFTMFNQSPAMHKHDVISQSASLCDIMRDQKYFDALVTRLL